MTTTKTSRRDFVGSVAAAGRRSPSCRATCSAAPGYTAPSDTLNVACIGVGGMGASDVKGMAPARTSSPSATSTSGRGGHLQEYPSGQEVQRLPRDARPGSRRTSTRSPSDSRPHPRRGRDDGHSGSASTSTARSRSPTRSREVPRDDGRRPRSTKVATQMGNQGQRGRRAAPLREWIEAGVIGNVREVHVWTNRPDLAAGHRAARPTRTRPRRRSTGTCGSAPRPNGPTTRPTTRSTGAAGGTSAPARWATWPATSWTRRSGSSTSGTPRA